MRFLTFFICVFCVLSVNGQSDTLQFAEELTIIKVLGVDSLGYIDPDILKSYNDGVELLENGQLSESIDAFTIALDQKPDFSKAYFNRAIAEMQLGNTQKAYVDFIKYAEIDSLPAEGFFQASIIKFQSGDYEESLTLLDKAIKENNRDARFNYEKGVIYFLMADFDAAIEEYTFALQKNPESPYALNDRASCKKENGDLKGAINDYENAIAVDPNFDVAWNNLGSAYRDENLFD